ncbi:MAG: hypothetical protein H7296_04655 [Bacteroidia bacterium]|nr:hypothetical protein [Bacteroidia bacterium]
MDGLNEIKRYSNMLLDTTFYQDDSYFYDDVNNSECITKGKLYCENNRKLYPKNESMFVDGNITTKEEALLFANKYVGIFSKMGDEYVEQKWFFNRAAKTITQLENDIRTGETDYRLILVDFKCWFQKEFNPFS